MLEKKIGDIRMFEKYIGNWKVIDIIKGKNVRFELTLKPTKCPYCGGVFGDKKIYVFNYIEKLREGGRILHLGVSDCNRYVLFEEYLTKKEIENAAKN